MPSASTGASPARVLLVDDSPISRELIGGQLAEWGYEVVTADCGREGVATFQRGGADVIVTDFMMPDMTGLEVLQAVRSSGAEIPVIMLSLHSQLGTILDAVRLGAFDYVIKDQDVEALREAMRRATAQLRLKRENARLLGELHEINAQLEGRVQERTRMLRETNQRLQSERQKLQRTLDRLHETQSQLVHAEKMATVGLLTAGVAHEINAPLAFVLPSYAVLYNWCELLASGIDDIEVRGKASEMLDLIREIKVALIRIRDVVQELGLFSRRGVTARSAVDLLQVVDSVCRLFGSQFRSRARLEVDVEQLPSISADPGQLRQVVLNLMVSAIGAIPAAQADSWIRVTGREAGSFVELCVAHSGEPLPEAAIQQIFNPVFSASEGSPFPASEGTSGGIANAPVGLVVSRHLAEKMGGMVRLREGSRPGTEVIVRLPKWVEPSESVEDVEESFRADTVRL